MSGGKHYKEELNFKASYRYREPQRWDEYLIEAEESAQQNNIQPASYDLYSYRANTKEDPV